MCDLCANPGIEAVIGNGSEEEGVGVGVSVRVQYRHGFERKCQCELEGENNGMYDGKCMIAYVCNWVT